MRMPKVACEICGECFDWIGGHLRVHTIKAEEYHKMYPNARMYSEEFFKNNGSAVSEALRGKPWGFLRECADSEVRRRTIEKARQSRVGYVSSEATRLKMSEHHWSKTNPEAFAKHIHKYWCAAAGEKGYLAVRKTRYLYDGIYFMSKIEIIIYKGLKSLGLTKTEVNYDFKVSNNRIDFFPMKEFFWEHHPVFNFHKESFIDYKNRRRLILDENGYEDYELIITRSYEEVNQVLNERFKKHVL